MDQMNQQIEQYLEKLVAECKQASNLPEDQIRNRLYQAVIDTIIDRLNGEQLSQLEAIDPESPEMEDKIEEFAAQIPNLAQDLDQKLKEVVATLKNPSQPSL